MRTGARGLALVKKWEGLRLAPYKDVAGLWTVGYGHLIKQGETFARISGEEAEELLIEDLIATEERVTELLDGFGTRPSEFDAMVAFHFNTGALHKATLLKLHLAGDRIAACLQFPVWHLYTDAKSRAKKPSRGLLRRRLDEVALYLEDA